MWWNEQSESIFDDGGYWVISRHEDIKAISRDGDLWSTNRKGVVMRMPDGTTPDQLELTKAMLINHDAPEHTRLRKLVSRLFTPRAVGGLEAKLADAAREIVADATKKDTGNFVDDIAMRLPLLAIADMLGVPEGDREKLFGWTNSIMNTEDPDFASDYVAANAELMGYAYTMPSGLRQGVPDGEFLENPRFAGDAIAAIEETAAETDRPVVLTPGAIHPRAVGLPSSVIEVMDADAAGMNFL